MIGKFHQQIIFLLVLPVTILEVTFRLLPDNAVTSYSEISAPLFQSSLGNNLLVFGSSRAATAIVSEQLESQLKENNILDGKVYNLGMGYTRIALHALMLRTLEKDNPKALTNSIVLIETVGGMPSDSTWKDSWVNPEFPLIILPFLDSNSLWSLMKTSAVSTESKLFILPSYYFFLPRQIAMCRNIIQARGAEFSENILNYLDHDSSEVDVANAGGMRRDIVVREDRDKFLSEICNLENFRKQQSSNNYWADSIVYEMATIVGRHNGKLFLFEPPQVPEVKDCLDNKLVSDARSSFIKQIQAVGGEVVDLDDPFTKEDFADLKHLKLSEAPEYTRILGDALLKKLKS